MLSKVPRRWRVATRGFYRGPVQEGDRKGRLLCRAGKSREAVAKPAVDGPGDVDAEPFHHHEADAVDEAVALVPVAGEVREGFALLLGGHLVNAPEDAGEELLTDPHRQLVPHRGVAVGPDTDKRDRLG